MNSKSHRQDVERFFHHYNRIFESFDPQAIAKLYNVPCVTVRGDGSIHAFSSVAEIEQFFGQVAERYKNDGYRSGTFFDLQVVSIGERSALASLTWEQRKSDNSLLREWRQSYNVVWGEGEWKVLTSTFHLS